jgi:hypothetical protein
VHITPAGSALEGRVAAALASARHAHTFPAAVAPAAAQTCRTLSLADARIAFASPPPLPAGPPPGGQSK